VAGVSALILAAGGSRRFVADKRLARLPGGSGVLEQTVDHCLQAGLDVLLVLGPGDEALAEGFEQQGIRTLIATGAAGGMGCSLAAGVAGLVDTAAVLVVLADMPYVKPMTLRGLADRLLSGAGIVRPIYKGRAGNPVGFNSRYLTTLAGLSGDKGARDILRDNPGGLTEWEVDDPGVIEDIDYPEDLSLA
jgi:molybdenum cofactor cytidylyltransferase